MERAVETVVAPPADEHLATVGSIEREGDPHRGRLAGSVGADEPRHPPAANRERQVVDGHRLSKPLRHGVRFDRRVHSSDGTSRDTRCRRGEPSSEARAGSEEAGPRPPREGRAISRSRTTRSSAPRATMTLWRRRSRTRSTRWRPSSPRGAAAARRVLSGPDGPLALALLLAMTATAEATLYTEEIEPALLTNLLATLPLALVRKRLAWATAAIVLAVLVALGEQALTISGLLALLIVLYLSASRYRRRWCVLLAFRSSSTPSRRTTARSLASRTCCCCSSSSLHSRSAIRAESAAARSRSGTRRVAPCRTPSRTRRRWGTRPDRARPARHRRAPRLGDRRRGGDGPTDDQALAQGGGRHSRRSRRPPVTRSTRMRRLLGVLREDANGAIGRVPQPGLAQLDELIETARAAGSTVRLTMSGEATTLPPSRPVRVPHRAGGAVERA